MKKTFYFSLLNRFFERSDFLKLHNKKYKYQEREGLYNDGELDEEDYSRIYRLVNSYFDNIRIISFNYVNQRNSRDDSETENDCTNRNQKLIKLKSKIENVLILFYRIKNTFQNPSKDPNYGNNMFRSIRKMFFLVCWDKWLRHENRNLFLDLLAEEQIFNQKLKNEYWGYSSNNQIIDNNTKKNTLDLLLENYNEEAEKNVKIASSDRILYTNMYTRKKNSNHDFPYSDIRPIEFYYQVLKETDNLDKYIKLIRLYLSRFETYRTKDKLFFYNLLAKLTHRKGFSEIEIILARKICKYFRYDTEKLIHKLYNYRKGDKFYFLDIVNALDFRWYFIDKFLRDDISNFEKFISGVYSVLDDSILSVNAKLAKSNKNSSNETLNENIGNMNENLKILRDYLILNSVAVKSGHDFMVEGIIKNTSKLIYNEEEFSILLVRVLENIILQVFDLKKDNFKDPKYFLIVEEEKLDPAIYHKYLLIPKILDTDFDLQTFFHVLLDTISVFEINCPSFAKEFTISLLRNIVLYKLDIRLAIFIAYSMRSIKRNFEYFQGLNGYMQGFSVYNKQESIFLSCNDGFIIPYDNLFLYKNQLNKKNRRIYDLHNYSVNRLKDMEIRIFNDYLAPFKETCNFVPNKLISDKLHKYTDRIRNDHELKFNLEFSEMEIEILDLKIRGSFATISTLLDLIEWGKNNTKTMDESIEEAYQAIKNNFPIKNLKSKCLILLVKHGVVDIIKKAISDNIAHRKIVNNGNVKQNSQPNEPFKRARISIPCKTINKSKVFLRKSTYSNCFLLIINSGNYDLFNPEFYDDQPPPVQSESNIPLTDLLKSRIMNYLKSVKRISEDFVIGLKMVECKCERTDVENAIKLLIRAGFLERNKKEIKYVP